MREHSVSFVYRSYHLPFTIYRVHQTLTV